jgi:nicotinamide-nucleotide amidase
MVSAEELLAQLARDGATLAVAESLTGGLLADAFVQVPGASAVFRGGIVAYATDLKHTLLEVAKPLLDQAGPVDSRVAHQMAAGVARQCQTSLGLAVTGVAGPTAQAGQPVGTVFVAVAGRWQGVNVAEVGRHQLSGDRAAIRAQAVRAALELLGEVVGRSSGMVAER